MSVMLSVRVSDELAGRVDAAGKRSEIVVRALEMYFSGGVSRTVVEPTRATPRYSRPAHDATCSCYRCVPPKAG